MSATFKTEAIILRRWNHREQDRGVRLLTRYYGKWTTRVISARKNTSKLAGHIEPFMVTNVFIVESRTIDILAGSAIVATYAQLRQDLQKSAIANYFCELVDTMTRERQRDVALYDYARQFLQSLNDHDATLAMLHYGIINLFSLLGYDLQFSHCVKCQRPLDETRDRGVYFSFALSGCLCVVCASKENEAPLQPVTLHALQAIARCTMNTVHVLQQSSVPSRNVHRFLCALIAYHLNHPLRSDAVLLDMFPIASQTQYQPNTKDDEEHA